MSFVLIDGMPRSRSVSSKSSRIRWISRTKTPFSDSTPYSFTAYSASLKQLFKKAKTAAVLTGSPIVHAATHARGDDVPTGDHGAGLIDKCNGMVFSELLDQRLLASVSLDGVLGLSAICGSLRINERGTHQSGMLSLGFR
jgi:hypothetical protein